ncbi:MAG TPA: phosphoribosylglycinamide formyltransferase [Steroidobacteraceae bacterium]|jgi:phosphoribosylglycinamide formyltransferase-1
MSARPPLRLAVLISGRGTNMTAIARACQAGAIDARVELVISDNAAAGGLASARELGIATTTVLRDPTDDRAAFEQVLAAAIDAQHPDVIALAGFMRILSPVFAARYSGRMLNIHPSILPAYRGLHTHRRVLEHDEAWHGASVHFVTAELDGGPVILQSRVPVQAHDTEESLSARVQATEYLIYPRVLGWFAQGRLAWQDGAAWLDGRRLDQPLVEDFRDPTH